MSAGSLVLSSTSRATPEGLNSDARNKREWLDAMDNLIAEHEEAIDKSSANAISTHINN